MLLTRYLLFGSADIHEVYLVVEVTTGSRFFLTSIKEMRFVEQISTRISIYQTVIYLSLMSKNLQDFQYSSTARLTSSGSTGTTLPPGNAATDATCECSSQNSFGTPKALL